MPPPTSARCLRRERDCAPVASLSRIVASVLSIATSRRKSSHDGGPWSGNTEVSVFRIPFIFASSRQSTCIRCGLPHATLAR